MNTALTGLDVVPLDQCVEAAMVVEGRQLRPLDALHVAAANIVDASDFITYDTRQADAAKAAGLATHAPTASE